MRQQLCMYQRDILLPLFRDIPLCIAYTLDLNQSINHSFQVSMFHEGQWTVQCYDLLIQLNTYQTEKVPICHRIAFYTNFPIVICRKLIGRDGTVTDFDNQLTMT